ncbi:hypothetical protein WUBG_00849 [Wuchereria bancrofti]|uniref:Uncharacterized protein n=1 Tax=Wuchereria bancrofti TaxID=6293 RepID=J9FLH4_WUCBA|nr:hypothetical protein WUBG_00849 [Wuchereria bancrofti]
MLSYKVGAELNPDLFFSILIRSGAGAKGNREGNEAVVPDGGVIKAPAQGAIAGTFDPNYQTMAGLGNDVFGADKGGVGGGGAGGGASPVVPRVNGPMVPAQGGTAGTYDPNYQTMAGLGNDVFGNKGGGGGGGGGIPPDGAVPKAPEQGGIAGTFDPNYQTLAGVGNDVFDKK